MKVILAERALLAIVGERLLETAEPLAAADLAAAAGISARSAAARHRADPLMDTSEFLDPADCPEPLRRWANHLIGQRIGEKGTKRGVRRIAGWRWDGVSDEVVAIVAPKGTRHVPIPPASSPEPRPTTGEAAAVQDPAVGSGHLPPRRKVRGRRPTVVRLGEPRHVARLRQRRRP